jgi:transcriptional regulator with XRE-family HTH domain
MKSLQLRRRKTEGITRRKKMLGTELKQRRKEAGLLGKELAKELGVSAETVSRWERGIHNIDSMAEKCIVNVLDDTDLVGRIVKTRRVRRMTDKTKRNAEAMNNSTEQ